jgi:hypothetical protein
LQFHAQSKRSSPILHLSFVEYALADGYAGALVGQFLYDRVEPVFGQSNPRKDDLATDSVVRLIPEKNAKKSALGRVALTEMKRDNLQTKDGTKRWKKTWTEVDVNCPNA